ncbi:22261_t:CDS:2 [Cetraspora pellucida]|uniref:22261_t:CDS:1 n=1 Tax=Cetraspora pellucida TaxID=1433469 RepID=A0A9N9JDH1_9GLOM|nr:22261_t:CDS:2 [Cetraspora pellucida]
MPSSLEKSPYRYRSSYSSYFTPKIVRNLLFISFTLLLIIYFYNIQTDIIISSPIYQTSNNNNVIVIVDGEQQAKALQPIYCNLSKKSRDTFIHVVVTGKRRGICGEELKKMNSKSPGCRVSVHDLGIRNSSPNDENVIFMETTHAINKIRPVVLIYIKNLNDNVMRGIDAAAIAMSSVNNKFTKIAIPIEYMNNTMFIADLPIEAIKQWNTPKFHVHVITQDRPASLKRLVSSLDSSIYLGDNVPLTINIDESADPDTIEYSHTVEWRSGKKNILRRTVQGGLVANIVESFYPTDNNDYGFIFEDDIEVSPFFYIWAKYTVLKYRYGPDRILSNRMFGVSLYNQKLIELTLPRHKKFNAALVLDPTKYNRRSPYLCQVPSSWGSLVFPEIWREFNHYITARLKDVKGPNLQDINIPESRSNGWHNSWKRFFIELIYLRGYVMLYPNYINYVSFSSNHHETGVHVHKKHRKGFLLPLMKNDIISEGLPGGVLPDYRNLPTLDLFGRVVSFHKLVERGHNLHRDISLCPPNDSATLTYDPKDLLCNRINIIKQNNETISAGTIEIKQIKQDNENINNEQRLNAKPILNKANPNPKLAHQDSKLDINDEQRPTANPILKKTNSNQNLVHQDSKLDINDEQRPTAKPDSKLDINYEQRPTAKPILKKNNPDQMLAHHDSKFEINDEQRPTKKPILKKTNPNPKLSHHDSKLDKS